MPSIILSINLGPINYASNYPINYSINYLGDSHEWPGSANRTLKSLGGAKLCFQMFYVTLCVTLVFFKCFTSHLCFSNVLRHTFTSHLFTSHFYVTLCADSIVFTAFVACVGPSAWSISTTCKLQNFGFTSKARRQGGAAKCFTSHRPT